MSWVRLRQVALVAHDLDAVVVELNRHFGLEVAYRDPEVARYGLRNAVLPVGDQFIEVVSPTRDGTAGGRHLERLGGDGGYMVICHTDEHEALRDRVQRLGVRAVTDANLDGYQVLQLHPSDTGGALLEIDFQPGGENSSGPWLPAGEDWQKARRTSVVHGIRAVEVQSTDPERAARQWGQITGLEIKDGTLQLDDGTVTFVEGRHDSLVGVTLAATTSRVGEQIRIGGVQFTLA